MTIAVYRQHSIPGHWLGSGNKNHFVRLRKDHENKVITHNNLACIHMYVCCLCNLKVQYVSTGELSKSCSKRGSTSAEPQLTATAVSLLAQ